jgi:amidase
MEIHNLGLLEVSERIRRRELTSTAVTDALLARIARHEGRLNSITLLLADQAMAQARQADIEMGSGFWRGPLHGVPIGLKDCVWTEGLPTTGGMEVLKDFRPAEDATIVKRLKRAGAVLIAKLHMTEGATARHHPNWPRPNNPWSAAHWTGVSSSGSGVATAAGFCFGAIGSDTGGSIRLPSSANNVTGFKPTWGRISRHGLMPVNESLDHLGPMARSTADAAAILQVAAGHDAADPTSLSDPVPDYLALMNGGASGLVLGVDWSFAAEGLAEPIVAALRNAVEVFADFGVRVREIAFPWSTTEAGACLSIINAEMAVAHADMFPAHADRYGGWLRKAVEAGFAVPAAEVVRAQYIRDAFKGRLRTLFREVDLVLTPGLGSLLPTWEALDASVRDGNYNMDLVKFTTPFNMGGNPTLSLPGGFTEDGLPIGLQLAAGWGEEAALIRAGFAFQQATNFHTRRPPLEDRPPERK